MKVTKKGENVFVVEDDDKVISLQNSKGKAVTSLTKAQADELLIALAQIAGLVDKAGKVKNK